MKVSLSYSVPLDNVLTTVNKLYVERKMEFDKKYNSLQCEFSEDRLQLLLKNIREIRLSLTEFDNGLGDINDILQGYQKIINGETQPPEQPLEQPQQQPPEETDD
tara:strand:- start:3464 stop:3778 length:315 start_codon:yes stop_codon:yes gene_type:complete